MSGDAVNHFDGLSDPVILSIFHLLDLRSLLNCSATCVRFYKIAQDKTLKRYIDLQDKDVNTGLLRKVGFDWKVFNQNSIKVQSN